ncbi:hypothetical protein [Viridibacillus arvi]|uniref:hypothetical protein n=1 Tax=Viridibacillus arvi TaxID=263475 RepID=UPI0034CF1445
MGRKAMNISEFNEFMKRCSEKMIVRYITPCIHASTRTVTAIQIHTSYESKEFTITNNPDTNFDLKKAVHGYLDSL